MRVRRRPTTVVVVVVKVCEGVEASFGEGTKRARRSRPRQTQRVVAPRPSGGAARCKQADPRLTHGLKGVWFQIFKTFNERRFQIVKDGFIKMPFKFSLCRYTPDGEEMKSIGGVETARGRGAKGCDSPLCTAPLNSVLSFSWTFFAAFYAVKQTIRRLKPSARRLNDERNHSHVGGESLNERRAYCFTARLLTLKMITSQKWETGV